jgi:hypothetical protein
MIFGLACEGVTDQCVLQNLLCGFYAQADLDEEIGFLQPPFDETDCKQSGDGNWLHLLRYLGSSRFREDVINNRYLLIQVDTDIAGEKGFDVRIVDAEPPEKLIKEVINRLITAMDTGEAGFYQRHAEQLVFAVSVHSLECWLYAYYNPKTLAKPKINGCFKALKHLLPSVEKNYRCYDELSQVFLQRSNIEQAAAKAPSLQIFLDALASLFVG